MNTNKIIDAILRDANDRSLLDGVDPDIVEEIRQAWSVILNEQVETQTIRKIPRPPTPMTITIKEG